MFRDYWTTRDILRRFRWRYRLYLLGWALFWLTLPGAVLVAFSLGLSMAGAAFLAGICLSLLFMVWIGGCLNCGGPLVDASISNRFRCRACQAVHIDPDKIYRNNRPVGHELVLPEGTEKCWVYEPMLQQHARRKKVATIGLWLTGAGLLCIVPWLVTMNTEWQLLARWPHAPLLGLVVLGGSGMALSLMNRRCPHCGVVRDSNIQYYDTRLIIWCGACNGVLSLSEPVLRIFQKEGKVLDHAPDVEEPMTVDEVIAEADALLGGGDRSAAFDVIKRGRLWHPNSSRLDDWSRKELDRMTRKL